MASNEKVLLKLTTSVGFSVASYLLEQFHISTVTSVGQVGSNISLLEQLRFTAVEAKIQCLLNWNAICLHKNSFKIKFFIFYA